MIWHCQSFLGQNEILSFAALRMELEDYEDIAKRQTEKDNGCFHFHIEAEKLISKKVENTEEVTRAWERGMERRQLRDNLEDFIEQ